MIVIILVLKNERCSIKCYCWCRPRKVVEALPNMLNAQGLNKSPNLPSGNDPSAYSLLYFNSSKKGKKEIKYYNMY